MPAAAVTMSTFRDDMRRDDVVALRVRRFSISEATVGSSSLPLGFKFPSSPLVAKVAEACAHRGKKSKESLHWWIRIWWRVRGVQLASSGYLRRKASVHYLPQEEPVVLVADGCWVMEGNYQCTAKSTVLANSP